LTPAHRPAAPRAFAALDGLRGVAAVFVAMRHSVFFHGLGVHGGYMAVDLFFVLSGFVIAHAYERRLEAGLSPWRFIVLRYARLWPVYLIGAVLGLIAAWLHALAPRDAMNAAQVIETAPFALAMLPGPPIKPMLYPVDAVAWSLALELAINAVYAFAWKPLRRPAVLAATLALSALALIGAVAWFGTLDIGFEWRNAIGGVPRVVYSFTAGLALHRLHQAGVGRYAAPAWIWVALLAMVFVAQLDSVIAPLVCALALFPLFVFGAAGGVQPGPRLARLFLALGAMSYPLYAIHKPLGSLAVLAARRYAPALMSAPPVLVGIPYILLVIGLSLAIERFYDLPVRRWLSALTQPRRAPPLTASPPA